MCVREGPNWAGLLLSLRTFEEAGRKRRLSSATFLFLLLVDYSKHAWNSEQSTGLTITNRRGCEISRLGPRPRNNQIKQVK